MYCLGCIELHAIRLRLMETGMVWAEETPFTQRMDYAFKSCG